MIKVYFGLKQLTEFTFLISFYQRPATSKKMFIDFVEAEKYPFPD